MIGWLAVVESPLRMHNVYEAWLLMSILGTRKSKRLGLLLHNTCLLFIVYLYLSFSDKLHILKGDTA